MDLAARRFAEQGYHPTSVTELVQALGVGKGVFYWYFSSKEQLFTDILREAQLDLRRRQQQAIGDETDPVRRIELGIRASVSWFEEHRHLFTLFQFAGTQERFRAVVHEGQDVGIADTVQHVKDGIIEGRIRDADPLVLAHGILGVTDHLTRHFVQEGGDPADQVADEAVAFCLQGLLAE
jgi:AcrR family transcriptional regulator